MKIYHFARENRVRADRLIIGLDNVRVTGVRYHTRLPFEVRWDISKSGMIPRIDFRGDGWTLSTGRRLFDEEWQDNGYVEVTGDVDKAVEEIIEALLIA